jgi:hypothetical protein
MATLASVILRDIAANRPAAGIAGRLFYDTTNSKMQRDNGSSWDDVAEASGLTNPMTTTGDIIVGGASGVPARLAVGAAGRILGSSGTTPSWVAVPTFRGCKAIIGSTTTMTTATTEYAVAFSGADAYDTDAIHDPASNNSRLVIPAALTGLYFCADAYIYVPITAGSTNYLDLKIRKNGAAGTVLSQVRVAVADGNPIMHLHMAPTVLVTSDYIELYAMSNVSGRTVDGSLGYFAIWAVGS